MEIAVVIIRIVLGMIFVGYGIFCIVAGIKRENTCLMPLINTVIAPIAVGIIVAIFPSIIEETIAMGDEGQVIIALAVFFFVVPALLGMFGRELLPAILNGLGFLFIGMIISGVISEMIIVGGIGVIVKLITVIFIPALAFVFFFGMFVF